MPTSEERMDKAERKALRRAKWRAAWHGFTHPFGSPLTRKFLEESRQQFWHDVERFRG
jgi:hypothetical protein